MPSRALTSRHPGPLERTADELWRIERLAAFRRDRRMTSRRRLHEADRLIATVEECRLRGLRLLPPRLWAQVVRLVGVVDPQLRDDLGINRHLDHVSTVLFSAQAVLMERSTEEREPFEAQIIELFAGARSAEVAEA